MKIFVWDSSRLKIDFSMKVFVFLVSGLLKIDVSMKVFVFFGSQAYWKLIFQWESLFFWSQAYWKLIFQSESLFFWFLLKIDFSMSLCFFGLRHCGRRRCALFHMNFNVFKARIVTMKSLFFVWALLKMHFSMRVFVFLTSGLLKMVFSMRVFAFWCQAYWKWCLNDSVCGFGLRHCGRRCCALFSFEFSKFSGDELFFNESLCFLVSGLLKINFSMKVFVFLDRPIKFWFV